jgi:3-deoxy-manno-octulosonate cytidylyltransferase (CMP-KDO synthetase)
MLRALGVIPARYASTRFPGKPLAPLGNGTLLSAVWSAARSARRLDRLVVATEDERIVEACRAIGAEAMLTSQDHVAGTDRVAEVVRRAGDGFDVVLNIQGDEPFVTGTILDRLVAAFDGRPTLQMATCAEPLDDPDDLFDPGCVKVVTMDAGDALYFSRAPIPYDRNEPAEGEAGWKHHLGLYAYRTAFLREFAAMPMSPLERREGLEQLRALEAGVAIRVASVPHAWAAKGIDTPDDYAAFVRRAG